MNNKTPLQIGITGGIGSGKSLVCRIFSTLGIPVYDADSRARWLMNHHSPLRAEITAAFGTAAYLPDGQLNRAYLASQVFNESSRVEQLNRLVHPRVGEDYAAWVQAQAHAPYVLKEAALLFESNTYRQLNAVIAVSAPQDLRVKRVLQRDPQRTEAEVMAIIHKQMDESEKTARANYIIYNDDVQPVLPQVLSLHQQFLTGFAAQS